MQSIAHRIRILLGVGIDDGCAIFVLGQEGDRLSVALIGKLPAQQLVGKCLERMSLLGNLNFDVEQSDERVIFLLHVLSPVESDLQAQFTIFTIGQRRVATNRLTVAV